METSNIEKSQRQILSIYAGNSTFEHISTISDSPVADISDLSKNTYKTFLSLLNQCNINFDSKNGIKAHIQTEKLRRVLLTFKDLDSRGYTKRLRYRLKNSKRIKGMLWVYTDKPNSWDLRKLMKYMDERQCELLWEGVWRNPVIDAIAQKKYVVKMKVPHESFILLWGASSQVDEHVTPENSPKKRNFILGRIPQVDPLWTATELKERDAACRMKNAQELIAQAGKSETIHEQAPPQQIMQEAQKAAPRKNKKVSFDSTAPENVIYLKYAEQLFNIVKTRKGYTISRTSDWTKWAKSFRDLVVIDKYEQNEVQDTLTWYSERINDAYIPECFSGDSFRSKFDKLQIARSRKVIQSTANKNGADDINNIKAFADRHTRFTDGGNHFVPGIGRAMELEQKAKRERELVLTPREEIQKAKIERKRAAGDALTLSELAFISDFIEPAEKAKKFREMAGRA